jgi:hypothetical protein
MPAPNLPIERPKTPLLDEETKSLLQLGFIVPTDFVFLIILGLIGFSSLIWIIATKPDFVYILAILICANFLTTIWVVTLVYRACYFVLKMRAVMETMPELAAHIALKLHEQQLNTPAVAGTNKPTPMPGGVAK